MAARPMLIARAHMQQLQQQSSSKRVGTLSLIHPAWVSVGPGKDTVLWSPISGKAVGGPITVHSSTVQKHGTHF